MVLLLCSMKYGGHTADAAKHIPSPSSALSLTVRADVGWRCFDHVVWGQCSLRHDSENVMQVASQALVCLDFSPFHCPLGRLQAERSGPLLLSRVRVYRLHRSLALRNGLRYNDFFAVVGDI